MVVLTLVLGIYVATELNVFLPSINFHVKIDTQCEEPVNFVFNLQHKNMFVILTLATGYRNVKLNKSKTRCFT